MSIISNVSAAAFALALIASPLAFAQEGGHGGGERGGEAGHGGGGDHADYRGGGYHGGGGHADRGGYPDRGYRGDGYRGGGRFYHGYGGYGYGGYPGYVGPFAVGAILGYYEGRPYYCYHRHHWRWSPYAGRYVSVRDRFC